MTTTVSERNQLSIPPEIAEEFHIHPGTRLEWSKSREGSIILTPLIGRAEMAKELLGAGRRWLKPGADPIGVLLEERDQDDRLDRADEQQ